MSKIDEDYLQTTIFQAIDSLQNKVKKKLFG